MLHSGVIEGSIGRNMVLIVLLKPSPEVNIADLKATKAMILSTVASRKKCSVSWKKVKNILSMLMSYVNSLMSTSAILPEGIYY